MLIHSYLSEVSSKTSSLRRLLTIDLFGALTSALLLGVVLPAYQPLFGIPRSVLSVLALPPLAFAAFDGWSLRAQPLVLPRRVRTIAGLNVAYCCLSAALALLHAGQLTVLGWGYLLGELFIVLLLATWQWRAGNRTAQLSPPSVDL